MKGYLLQPVYECFDSCAEGFLGAAVVESTIFVKFCLSAVPLDDELLREDLLVVHELHEGACELHHFGGVAVYEELNDRLEKMADADLAILLNQSQENLFVVFPSAENVSLGVGHIENAANEEPVAELRRETDGCCKQADFLQQSILEDLVGLAMLSDDLCDLAYGSF